VRGGVEGAEAALPALGGGGNAEFEGADQVVLLLNVGFRAHPPPAFLAVRPEGAWAKWAASPFSASVKKASAAARTTARCGAAPERGWARTQTTR
jgi:hypothetical protein